MMLPYYLNLFLIFVRILAVFMTAPIFSNRSLPMMIKIGLAGFLTIILLPGPASAAGIQIMPVPSALWPFLFVMAQEILVGMLVGFASNLIFVAIGMAASLMGLQIGFQAANLLNPLTNSTSSALEQLYMTLTLTLFLTVNGHHLLIKALADTFEIAPIGQFTIDNISAGRLIAMSGQTFTVAVQLALPIVGTLLLTDLGLGLIARAVPQVQVFFLGLPLKMGLGLLILMLTLNLTWPVIRSLFDDLGVQMLTIVSP